LPTGSALFMKHPTSVKPVALPLVCISIVSYLANSCYEYTETRIGVCFIQSVFFRESDYHSLYACNFINFMMCSWSSECNQKFNN